MMSFKSILVVTWIFFMAELAEGVSNACIQRVYIGPCIGQILRYHYNQVSRRCEAFMYGGCGGNANNFKTKAECLNTCSTNGFSHRLNPCSVPQVPGTCSTRIPSFYYNRNTGQCEIYMKGGCNGNSKTFDTMPDCINACNINGVSNPCSQPIHIGPCIGQILRYHYNQVSRRCEVFMYGGCEGNANNFKTKAECLNTCSTNGHLRGYFKRLSSTHGHRNM